MIPLGAQDHDLVFIRDPTVERLLVGPTESPQASGRRKRLRLSSYDLDLTSTTRRVVTHEDSP